MKNSKSKHHDTVSGRDWKTFNTAKRTVGDESQDKKTRFSNKPQPNPRATNRHCRRHSLTPRPLRPPVTSENISPGTQSKPLPRGKPSENVPGPHFPPSVRPALVRAQPQGKATPGSHPPRATLKGAGPPSGASRWPRRADAPEAEREQGCGSKKGAGVGETPETGRKGMDGRGEDREGRSTGAGGVGDGRVTSARRTGAPGGPGG